MSRDISLARSTRVPGQAQAYNFVTASFRRSTVEPKARIIGTNGHVQSNGRVVLVEPDDLIRRLLEQWLAEAGYSTGSQTLGTFGEREVAANPPRLVIADIPSLHSGTVIVDRIRQTYGGPLLLLSARFRHGLGSSRTAARRFGVRKVLPKPFARVELLQAVKEAIS